MPVWRSLFLREGPHGVHLVERKLEFLLKFNDPSSSKPIRPNYEWIFEIMDLTAVLEKTVSPGKWVFFLSTFLHLLCRHFVKFHFSWQWENAIVIRNSFFSLSDQAELEAAQQFLEQAAQQNVVSLSITYFSQPVKYPKWPTSFFFFLSFSIYCQTLFRVLSAGVLCTLRVAGWKPTSNHIEITVGFFNLHRGWLSLHRGHPVNVPIRRTMHLSGSVDHDF